MTLQTLNETLRLDISGRGETLSTYARRRLQKDPA